MIISTIDPNPIRSASKTLVIPIKSKYFLSPEQVKKIIQVLEKGDRIELIPCKDGVKIIQETRKEIK